MSVFGKVWNFIKTLFVRAGLDKFLKKYQQKAIMLIGELAEVRSGQGLHEWWDEAFAAVKAEIEKDTSQWRDNWVAILINLAFEVIKAEQEKDGN